MSEPKTTIDLPFSPEDVRMGRHLGDAIAGYRDGDFKRSAEGMVEAVRAFQAAAAEIGYLRSEKRALNEMLDAEKMAAAKAIKALMEKNERLREAASDLLPAAESMKKLGRAGPELYDAVNRAVALLASTAPKTEDA